MVSNKNNILFGVYMKLVFKTNDNNEANKYHQLLEEKGIPSVCSEMGLNNIGTHIPGGIEVRIYVNAQYDDAIQLLDNPLHEVKEVIDLDEFNQFYDSQQRKSELQVIYKLIIKVGFIVTLLAILLVTYLFNQ